MTTVEETRAGLAELHDAVTQRIKASPPWLADRRTAAWDAFSALPMPSSQHDEDWRRTDISGLHLERFRPATSLDDGFVQLVRQRQAMAIEDAARVIDGGDGHTRIENADHLLAQGVIISSLEDAAERHGDLLQRALERLAIDETKFTALWSALTRGGCFIYVPRAVRATVPVWIAHVATTPQTAVFPATIVVVEQAASLTLIDDFVSPAGEADLFSDAVTLLVQERDSAVRHCVLQQWGEGVWHIATHRAHLEAGARLDFFGATLGSRLQKAWWQALLDGPGAEARYTGICFGDDDQHLDHQSLQAHRAPQTTSALLLKTAVRGRARSVYSGLIDVEKQAQQTDGHVESRNLILSHGAKADTIPRLEIKANDVKCGHGATAGHIDDEQRFYLMSRGVAREDADRLIVRGFMDDALARAPHPGIGELVSALLDEEIEGHAQAGLQAEAAP